MKKIYIGASFFLMGAIIISGCSLKPDGTTLPVEDNSSIIFFYGQECPHCKDVEKYFEENKIEEKVQFSKREVYHNKANVALLNIKAKTCGIEDKSLGVPFLWAEGKCYMGPSEIEKFFNEKAGLNK